MSRFSVIFFLIAFSFLSAESAPRQYFTCSEPYSGHSICDGSGDSGWPKAGTPLLISAASRELFARDAILNGDNFEPLPRLDSLTALTIEALLSVNSDGAKIDFPLEEFTGASGNSYSELKQLRLHSLRLNNLAGRDFSGFPALERLFIDNCNLAAIGEGSFVSFSNLRELYISNEARLKSFSWSALASLAQSLEVVQFRENRELATISNDARTPFLGHLRSLLITWSKMTEIPQSVLDSLNPTSDAKNPVVMDFKFNRNRCGTCDLSALVNWANSATSDRAVSATCRNPTTGLHSSYLEIDVHGTFATNPAVLNC